MADEIFDPVTADAAAAKAGDLVSRSERELRKAHEAIAVLPRSGRLTLLDRRFFNVLLSLAQSQQQGVESDVPIFREKFSRILAGAKFDSNNTEVAKEHLRKMASTTVEWAAVSDQGKRRWGVSTMLADAEIIEEGNELIVEWSYGAKIRAKLLSPESYARISLEMHSSLRSSQSAALFEICERYRHNPGRVTHRAPWQWWKPRLTGNPEDVDDQGEYKYFKRDVLRMAISEINSLTDLEIELIEHRVGRKVSEIQFGIKIKPQQKLNLPDPNLIDNALLERLQRFGFSQAEAVKLYSDHDEPLLRVTADYVDARARDTSKEPLGSPAAFFRTALNKRYAVGASGKALPAPKPVKPALPKEPAKVDTVIAGAKARYAALSDGEQAALLDRFRASPAALSVGKYLDKQGLKSRIAAAAFFAWYAAQ